MNQFYCCHYESEDIFDFVFEDTEHTTTSESVKIDDTTKTIEITTPKLMENTKRQEKNLNAPSFPGKTSTTSTTEEPITEEPVTYAINVKNTNQAKEEDEIFENMSKSMKNVIQEKCTKKNVREHLKLPPRIIGGVDTEMDEHLWAVPILYQKKNSSKFLLSFICPLINVNL